MRGADMRLTLSSPSPRTDKGNEGWKLADGSTASTRLGTILNVCIWRYNSLMREAHCRDFTVWNLCVCGRLGQQVVAVNLPRYSDCASGVAPRNFEVVFKNLATLHPCSQVVFTKRAQHLAQLLHVECAISGFEQQLSAPQKVMATSQVWASRVVNRRCRCDRPSNSNRCLRRGWQVERTKTSPWEACRMIDSVRPRDSGKSSFQIIFHEAPGTWRCVR